jgi:hypothetical protein
MSARQIRALATVAAPLPQMAREREAQIRLLSQLEDAVRREAGDTVLMAILQQFIEQTNVHFFAEQFLLCLGVGGNTAHIQERDHLKDEIWRLQKALFKGKITQTHDLVDALKRWLTVQKISLNGGNAPAPTGNKLQGEVRPIPKAAAFVRRRPML